VEGWQWRLSANADHPVYWQQEAKGRWLRRNFDEWVALEERLPAIHINWHEANAYCRWAKRRLPAEAEWEISASAEPSANGLGLSERKLAYPWGDVSPTVEHANLDSAALGCVPVDALPAGDSAFGCRQMIGNTWEWTASDFQPYPGFVAGPYQEYSSPGSEITKSCAAVVGSLVRASFITVIEISTHPIVGTYGRVSARVRFRARKNENRNSNSSATGLTPRKPDYCASVGHDSKATWQ
jgi:formylglycine-generating enzyme required for sulfatase activity